MLTTIVDDLLIILAAGLGASLVCRRLHVSVLVGYLLVGVLVGAGCLGWVTDEHHEIEHIAEAGVFLLLFSIGLEFSLDELVELGRNLLIGGTVQVVLVTLPLMAVLMGMQLEWRPALLLASAASFSSTVLVFKVLSEWGHSSLPHGRRAIGILLFQDAALIPLLLLIPLLTGSGKTAGIADYAVLVATSVLFVAATVGLRQTLTRWVIPRFARSGSPELIVLFTLVLLGAVTFAAYRSGLPPAIGAFAAGLIFSGNRWTKQIDALVLPFREAFAVVFFVSLGLLCDPWLLWREPFLMAACLAGLILVKMIAATIALYLTGLPWRVSIGMGIGLAHVGEFAFVVVMLGWEAGVISQSDYQRLIALAIGSLLLTPVLLKFGLRCTRHTEATLTSKDTTTEQHVLGHHAIVIGAGPTGRQAASQLETVGNDVCVVDLSPINLHGFAQQGFHTVAGDATDGDLLQLANVPDASIIVVSVGNDDSALHIVRLLRQANPNGFVLVRCRFQSSVARLVQSGATEVVSEEAEATTAVLESLRKRVGAC